MLTTLEEEDSPLLISFKEEVADGLEYYNVPLKKKPSEPDVGRNGIDKKVINRLDN